jgi:hypothetical protein
MEYIKKGMKLEIAAIIISVCLLLLIGSFIINTKMQALAQLPDHLYTPHTGIVHQIPGRVTLIPVLPNK